MLGTQICDVCGIPVVLLDLLLDDSLEWASAVDGIVPFGGDRFAGNVVVLPEGLYYGRVRPEEAWTVLDEHLAGRIHLPIRPHR